MAPRKAASGPRNNRPETALLSGNEAIARGAWEAGVRVASAYPGTPSTEILEALARYPEVDCEWSTNEKVAMEVAIGASVAGGRALAAMKHVGLNVAADPFFAAAYAGTNGGLVVVSADDPGMHSSQNEQDNRLLARAARVPMLEPSTAEEARRFTRAAFALSEKYDIPVLIRTTTRVSHGNGEVPLGPRERAPVRPYLRDPQKYVMLPAHARQRHIQLELERMPALQAEAERWVERFPGSREIGVITSGAAFLYAREAFKGAAFLKLNMTHPIPAGQIRAFAKNKRRILVVEELEPYLEEQVRGLGIRCEGKGRLPRFGELSVGLIREAFLTGAPAGPAGETPLIPPRPPVLCAGCAHRGVFYVLGQLDAIVSGDIGCYTLGALAPLDAMDTCFNMGASVAVAHGMEKVLGAEERRRLVSVIGDSTFYHSGIPGLIDILYNGGSTTTVILDNRTTAMTGHQEHPGSGRTLRGEAAPRIALEPLARGLGIQRVRRVDPYDLLGVYRTLDEEMGAGAPSVVLAEADCGLLKQVRFGDPIALDRSRCTECMACTRLGCPAIEMKADRLDINPILCVACTHCQQVCADCNAGIDLSLVLERVHQKRYDAALAATLRTNPFPLVSSLVCPHPCGHEVTALGYPQASVFAKRYPELARAFPAPGDSAAISLRAVERMLGEWGLAHLPRRSRPPGPDGAPSVGIVGAGPAGLSAAWQLARGGFAVTVYEAMREPGGMMRYGIPGFRLPKGILKKEISRIRLAGAEIRCGVRVGKDIRFEALCRSHDAVAISVGDPAPETLPLEGIDRVRSGLHYGIDFLRRLSSGRAARIGRRVAVIGGGNTALDCARSARALGAEVTVYYRRSRDETPAICEEIEAAESDGVGFEYRSLPVALRATDGRVTGLHLVRTRPGPPDESGRPCPENVPGSAFEIAADTVILAIGERADLDFLKLSRVAHGKRIDVDFMGQTSRPGVFACGDAAFGHGTVTQAISTGRRAAEAIAAFLGPRNRWTR